MSQNLSSNYLLEQGIVLIDGPIDDGMAQVVTCQLLYLNRKYPDRSIQLWINSPGGSVAAGFAIYDVMNYVKPSIETVAIGMAASMAAFILSSGTYGKRSALPNAEIMIHQPLGQAEGQSTDIVLAARHIERTRDRLERIMAMNTGKDVMQIHTDTERDYIMLANEAKEYGLIDVVIETEPKAARR